MSGQTKGGVRMVLRLEGAGVLLAALLLYAGLGAGWGNFALFFFAPDIAFVGYLAGPRVGALTYNLTHSYLGAIACLVLGHTAASPLLLAAGTIWGAHIGFDRTLGYGLKYARGFGATHLGLVGWAHEGKFL